jgi:acetyl esterase/lipase
MKCALIVLSLIVTVRGAAAQTYKVRVVSDVDYVPEADYADNKDKLDIYIPVGKPRFPVVISVHGGSLVEGDKSQETHIGQTMAGAGVGAVVINYRLTPTVSFPGHIEDVARAFAWTKQHIAEHGGDSQSVYTIGHSAGAYLVALLALDPKYLEPYQLKPSDIRGVVPVSAFWDVDQVAPDRPLQIWGANPDDWIAASPSRYFHPSAPPFLILYADRDENWRRWQNEQAAEAMKNAGNPNTSIKQIGNRNHMSVWSNVSPGDDVTKAILAFITQKPVP